MDLSADGRTLTLSNGLLRKSWWLGVEGGAVAVEYWYRKALLLLFSYSARTALLWSRSAEKRSSLMRALDPEVRIANILTAVQVT